MNRFTWPELADMHLAYGESHGNSREARRIYMQRHPNADVPDPRYFATIHQRFREGTLNQVSRCKRVRRQWTWHHEHGFYWFEFFRCRVFLTRLLFAQAVIGGDVHRRVRAAPVGDVAFEEDVLERVANNPKTSTRAIASQVGANHVTVWQVLHDNNLYPFKAQQVQHLKPEDYPRRVAWAEWFAAHADVPILWSDEKTFSREGIFNPRNSHHWAEKGANPHERYIRGYQDKFTVNTWAGLIGQRLIGPFVLPARMNAANYLVFLQQVLEDHLDDLPLDVWNAMWFQHDGAPPHVGRLVREHLDARFPERWIGRFGPVAWPARSPDLNPLDFFFWGRMDALVYEDGAAESEEDLIGRIVAAAGEIRDQPDVIGSATAGVRRRTELCLQQQGGHFEHLLH